MQSSGFSHPSLELSVLDFKSLAELLSCMNLKSSLSAWPPGLSFIHFLFSSRVASK